MTCLYAGQPLHSAGNSVEFFKVTGGHVDHMRVRSADWPVLERDTQADRVQGTFALLFVRGLEALPEIRRERGNGSGCAICIFKSEGASHPVHRHAFRLRPLSQAGSQQLLSVHLHDLAVGDSEVCARRHSPTREKPDDSASSSPRHHQVSPRANAQEALKT